MRSPSIEPFRPPQGPQIQTEAWYTKALHWLRDLFCKIGSVAARIFGFGSDSTSTPQSVGLVKFQRAEKTTTLAPSVIHTALETLKSPKKTELKQILLEQDKTNPLLETFCVLKLGKILSLDKLGEVIAKMSNEPDFKTSANLTKTEPKELATEILKFLQDANEFCLVKAFEDAARVPRETPLAESLKLVREWLNTPEAQNKPTLDFSRKNLLFLPREVYQLRNLEELNLETNRLANLSEEIKNLKKLRFIDLDYNEFSTFPEPLCSLKQLLIFTMIGNPVKTFDLQVLDLFPKICAYRYEPIDKSSQGLTTLHRGGSMEQLAEVLDFKEELTPERLESLQRKLDAIP